MRQPRLSYGASWFENLCSVRGKIESFSSRAKMEEEEGEKTLALSQLYAKLGLKCLKNQPNRDQRSFSQSVTITCIGTRHQCIRLHMKGYGEQFFN